MIDKPEVVSSEEIYSGWLKLRRDILKIDGFEDLYSYDVVEIDAGVGVLPFLDAENVLLARQYRHPIGQSVLELVQGGISNGENSEEAARRELMEETGYEANFEYLLKTHLMPGSLNQSLSLFIARDMKKVREPKVDGLERMEYVSISYRKLIAEILEGRHADAALVSGALFYHSKRIA